MHGSLEKQPREGKNAYRNWDIKFIAFPILGVVALIAFVVSHPAASKWIADAAQAEFVNIDLAPELQSSTSIAQPNNEVRTVKAY